MFLGVYHFEGDRAMLLAAYEKLVAGFPPGAITLQLCLATERGISIYDACPSQQDFRAFAASEDLRAAFAGVGLPEPKVEELGDVHRTTLSDAVRVSR